LLKFLSDFPYENREISVDYYWLWAILLLVVGFLLVLMEVFFPSMGVLAFLAAASLIGAIVFGYLQGTLACIAVVTMVILGVPIFLAFAFKLWPKTAIGRRIMLDTPQNNGAQFDDPEKEFLKSLVGRIGKTKCKLLPSGIIFIDGRKIDAVSEGMPIEVNQEVRVIQIRGKRAVVRPLDEDAPSSNASNPLRRPIEELIEDPFENPPR
jgi:membrane-bound ClpP family serine protease